MGHMIGHKTSLNKFKKIEIIPQRTETRNQPQGKYSKTLKLMEIEWHAIKQWMGQELDQGGNQKLSGNKWKWTHKNPKWVRHNKGSPEREVHSNTGLP